MELALEQKHCIHSEWERPVNWMKSASSEWKHKPSTVGAFCDVCLQHSQGLHNCIMWLKTLAEKINTFFWSSLAHPGCSPQGFCYWQDLRARGRIILSSVPGCIFCNLSAFLGILMAIVFTVGQYFLPLTLDWSCQEIRREMVEPM